MFEKLGRFIVRRRKGVLTIFLLSTLAAGAIGSLAFENSIAAAIRIHRVSQPKRPHT